MVGVLVTRPKETGLILSAKLRTEGYEVWHEPLLEIHPFVVERPKFVQQPVVVLTSRSSLQVLQEDKGRVVDLLACPCFCVGDQTAQEADAFGFQNIYNVKYDAEALADLIIQSLPEKRPVLHICGEDRSTEPEQTLRVHGWSYYPWSVYKAQQIDDLSPAICDIIKEGRVDVVLFFSVRTARIFVTLIRKNALESFCAHMTAIGLSKSVISALGSLSLQRSFVASSPHEADLLSRLHTSVPSRGGSSNVRRS